MDNRLLKAINLVKQKEGMTDELTSKIDTLYVFGKISDDEYADITISEVTEETTETEESEI